MFPEVKQSEKKYNPAERNERYRYQCPVVMRYLENKLRGWNIGVFFEQIKAEKIALYAVTEFTEYVLRDLELSASPVEVVCVADKNFARFPQGICAKEVVSPEKVLSLYQSGEIDKLVVCSLFHENAIFGEFIDRGVRQEDLISVTSAIFSFDMYGGEKGE